jgi:hypothetical protein
LLNWSLHFVAIFAIDVDNIVEDALLLAQRNANVRTSDFWN